MYSNDSLGIVMWDHRPGERFAPHGKICEILRAAIKDDKTEENTFEILQHSDRNKNNS